MTSFRLVLNTFRVIVDSFRVVMVSFRFVVGSVHLALGRGFADKLRAQGSSTSHEVKRTIDIVAASIDVRRPDLTPHAAPDGTVTLMFSDMEGFTEMTHRLGDLAAREVIRRHNTIVRQSCVANGGYDALKVGQEVRFSEDGGDQGPAATLVQPIGKHHLS